MSVVQDIGTGLSTEYVIPSNSTEGKELEMLLTNICKDLGKVSNIVEDSGDLEFLLMIVGSYLIASQSEEGLEEGARPPSVLFDETLMPQIRAMDKVVDVEVIEDEE